MMDKYAYQRFCTVHERALSKLRGIVIMSGMPGTSLNEAKERIGKVVEAIVNYEEIIEGTPREDAKKAVWSRVQYLDRKEKSKTI